MSSGHGRLVAGEFMRTGYGRVSTLDQNPELQIDALQKAGCESHLSFRVSPPLLGAALPFKRGFRFMPGREGDLARLAGTADASPLAQQAPLPE
jgi:hypothetical protein